MKKKDTSNKIDILRAALNQNNIVGGSCAPKQVYPQPPVWNDTPLQFEAVAPRPPAELRQVILSAVNYTRNEPIAGIAGLYRLVFGTTDEIDSAILDLVRSGLVVLSDDGTYLMPGNSYGIVAGRK